jgi:hypothetical protein
MKKVILLLLGLVLPLMAMEKRGVKRSYSDDFSPQRWNLFGVKMSNLNLHVNMKFLIP